MQRERERNDPPDLTAPLFRFAILADTHMNARDGESSSPWLTNRQANARADAVVQAINSHAPAFTIHLGDMVHPIPAQQNYDEAAKRALATFARLENSVHYVPGNHDIGDKPLDWMPAEVVNDDFIAAYERHFGADHYAFDHGDCRFIILNAQILNSGLERESRQWQWLEATLGEAANKRLFVFSHYPPYIATPDEGEHYDNLGEAGRRRLLDLLARYEAEACFSAHVHNFFYDRHHRTDMYVMPAVSAIRHDYSEIFRVAPGDAEHGRDDNAKLGFFLVDVYAGDHIAHYVRSYGATASQNKEAGTESRQFRVPGIHSRQGQSCPVGVDMRQAWARTAAITPSGAVDEFYRKKARNDYVLAALWETGIRKLRVPMDDLLDPEARQRLSILYALGHEILLFCYEAPQGEAAAVLADHAGLFSALEVIVPSHRTADVLPDIADLGNRTGLPVYLSRLRSSAEAQAAGARYTHFITHGFGEGEEAAVAELMAAPAAKGLEGAVFRIAAEEDVVTRLSAVAACAEDVGVRALVHVTLADENPAQIAEDESAITNRVIATLLMAWTTASQCSVYLDTFADIDRGYFPRLGLFDRRYNPRLAGRAFSALQAELAMAGELEHVEEQTVPEGHILVARNVERSFQVILPTAEFPLSQVSVPAGALTAEARIVDLESGHTVTGQWSARGDQQRLEAEPQLFPRKPFLIASKHMLTSS